MGVDKVFLYKGGKAHAAEVKTGLRTDSSIQIIDGLNVGDTLITSGTLQRRLAIGQIVRRAERLVLKRWRWR